MDSLWSSETQESPRGNPVSLFGTCLIGSTTGSIEGKCVLIWRWWIAWSPRRCRLTAIALEANTAVGAGYVVEQLLRVLADEWFLMVTRDVMPGDAVVVNIVQDGHAGLVGAVDVILGVVRLPDFLVAGLWPWIEAPTVRHLVGGCHLFAIRRPEPAEQGLGLEITSIFAALEVAETSRRPDVRNVVWGKKQILHEIEKRLQIFLT